MPKEKSVGAIIYRIENGVKYYLLLKYTRKHWDFVKGHSEPGETEEQTLYREAEEEAGLEDLEIISGFKETTKFVFRQYKNLMTKEQIEQGKTVWVFKIVTFYLAKTQTKNIVLSAEHQDYKWLPIDQALKQTTFKGSKDILYKAEEFLRKKE